MGFYRKRDILGLAFFIFVLGGCSAQNSSFVEPPNMKVANLLNDIPQKDRITYVIKEGIKNIENGKYQNATKLFNEGLRLSPDNANLHFLNGLSYHLQSLNGNSKMLDLAQTGYTTSLMLDDTNYWASYFLGNIYFKKKEYRKAQNEFAHGLLFEDKNPYLLRGLAVASYYCNDIALNSWASQRAYEVDPENLASLRNLLFSQAASGKNEIAKATLQLFNKVLNEKYKDKDEYMRKLSFDLVSNRVNDWKNYYALADNYPIFDNDDTSTTVSQDFDDSSSLSSENSLNTIEQKQSDNTTTVTVNKNLPKMTLVDVAIIQTNEVKSQSKGINLLDGLKTTLSGTMYSRIKTTGTGGSSMEIYSPEFSFMNLEYNFNIFNDDNNKAEILARPSLLAVENKPSKFYSGSTLHVQLSSSNADGSMEDVPVGLNLNIIPRFLGDDTLEISVEAKRAFLESLSENVGFTAFSQTSQTSVEATAVLKFDETLILSGLTESTSDDSESGVPILQDIPGVQYLFSRSEKSETRKSILILLTPRKPRYYNEILSHEQAIELEEESDKKETYYTKILINKEKITVSNSDAILSHLGESKLFSQFRTGDLKLDDWNNDDTFEGSVKRVLGFLYY
ncbi:type II and III secretion system protein [Halarcobacter ebronensis]|uniref:Type II/III secretion system secretin-like domain-containing protein n=1 Tax=Halarcobacter ebronensis TaxID=1462615 RepID=A0A4Q1AI46_9BACT|nr:type II and III secretion system protein [Halarcobacter ebronensis]QKF83077.1 type II and III secretion system protein [Halarcobacter ebronensis]RXK02408.1 hypothetical protein CRV07_13770 [Halarcobacter ebronensis]